MLFLFAPTGELVVLLTEQDVNNMRAGRTVFVDERHLKGQKFTKLIASVVKDQNHAMELLKQSGHKVSEDQIVKTEPKDQEAKCEGCQGIMLSHLLLAGKCIVCWKESADHYRQEALESWKNK